MRAKGHSPPNTMPRLPCTWLPLTSPSGRSQEWEDDLKTFLLDCHLDALVEFNFPICMQRELCKWTRRKMSH
ncbi:hypothetical protein CHARACLAT_005243 [Characodon lateralis]|uniref:Uncharacterized protein n=1 Tax=Characodon lateralis TaxID=208331 RepID=A0ABU7DXW1_9TELE|nr:hypothetical protein [Characodon lateralis]